MQGLDIVIYLIVHISLIVCSILVAKTKSWLKAFVILLIFNHLFFGFAYIFEIMKKSGIILNKNADIYFHYMFIVVYIIVFTIYFKRKKLKDKSI